MAKAETKTKEPAAPAAEFKYTIADLESALGIQATSIRVGLRESPFQKTGRTWGWNTKAELDGVIKFFKDRSARAPDMTKKSDAAKPAKAAKPVKAAKTEKAKAA